MDLHIRPLPADSNETSADHPSDARTTRFMDALRARVAAQDAEQRQPSAPPAAPAPKKRQKSR